MYWVASALVLTDFIFFFRPLHRMAEPAQETAAPTPTEPATAVPVGTGSFTGTSMGVPASAWLM